MKMGGGRAVDCVTAECSSSLGLDLNFESEPLEAADEVEGYTFFGEPVQVRFAKLVVGRSRGKHVVGRDQDLASDGHGGAFMPAPGLEPEELVLQVASLLDRGGVGRLYKGGFQVNVPLTNPPTPTLAGTFVVARTDPGPGSQVVGAMENAHVGAEFGDHHGGQDPIHPGDLRQPRVRLGIRLELLLDSLLEFFQIDVGLLE